MAWPFNYILARSAEDMLARYNRACELKQTPDRDKIILAIRRWAAAIGTPDVAITFADNTAGVKKAMRVAGDAKAAVKPVVQALCSVIGRTAWKWTTAQWGALAAARAGAAGELAMAALDGRNAFTRAAAQRDTSAARQAWGLTGPTWFFYDAWDLHDLAQNAIWASAGGRPITEPIVMSSESRQELLQKWLGLFEAFEAGAWIIWIGAGTVHVAMIPSQVVLDDRGRLHSADGPAFVWLEDIRGFYWHGVYMPEYVIVRPAEISIAMIDAETNAEVRRVMIERYKNGEQIHGAGAYMLDAGGARLDYDERFGTLWRRDIPGDEPIVVLEVINTSREPDGGFKHYWLRVPPNMKTAREAAAWTFDVPPDRYAPTIET